MPKTNKQGPVLRGEFSTVVDLEMLRASSNGNLPDLIPVLPKGEFMTLPYGNMVLNDAVFEQMIGNFKGGIRRAVPLDFDHAWENTKAGGWIAELINKEDGLWARVDYNKLGKEAVEEKIYRMISAEWSFDYVDPQKSTHHGAVLVAATLTNRPLMQSMPTITASELASGEKNLTNGKGIMILLNENTNTQQSNSMNIADILKKPVAERTPEEVKFLEEATDLTDEQKTQLETEKTDAANADADKDADKDDADNADDADKGKDEDADDDADDSDKGDDADADKTEEVKASELTRLRKIEADHKAAETLKAATDFITPFMASANGGKVLPAGKEAFIKLASSLNAEQKALLQTVLSKTADQKVTEVKGQDNKDGLTATEQYNNLISEAIKAGKSPAEANKIVRKENKAIYDAFIAESK